MEVYLLCLRKNRTGNFQAENIIFDAACNFGLKKENCESFGDVHGFFRRLSEIMEGGALVLLASDTELFADTKRMLISALSLNEPSDGITADMKSATPALGKTVVLPSLEDDFSGFAAERGKNSIIYLPLDDKITGKCLGEPFFKFMSEAVGENAKNTANSDNNLEFAMSSISQKAADICSVLAERRLKASFSLSNTGEKLCRILPDMEQLRFFPSSSERKNTSPKDYAAMLAKEAAERPGTNIGASITNVFKVQSADEPQIFVCIAVADSNGAKVKKIYAQPGESALVLTVCALDSVLEMIREKAVMPDAENEEISPSPAPSIEEKNRKKMFKYTALAGTAALFLCMSIGIGAVILKPDSIPAAPGTGTSEKENDKGNFDYNGFWGSLFNNDSDENATDDIPDAGEPDNNDIHSSVTPHASSPAETNSDTNASGSESASEQQTTEKPAGETEPTEQGTDDTSESAQETTSEPASETKPTEPAPEPTVTENSTAAENRPDSE